MSIIQSSVYPSVTLVGAGPGDPDLISVKGLRALMSADVVLYDALVNRELLKHVPIAAHKIYVGKRAGRHSYSQDAINRLLAESALNHGHVVRLKGGDPFVFGRGHDELEYLHALDIPVEIVPGITSAISVPELQGIPVTKRGVSDSFWVLTGTTKEGALSKDLALAAQSSATVVILMGMKKLAEIAALFASHGKQDTAVAIIQNGSLATENTGFGTINTIVDVAAKERLAAPAIIVVGDVVNSHPTLTRRFLDHTFFQSKITNN